MLYGKNAAFIDKVFFTPDCFLEIGFQGNRLY